VEISRGLSRHVVRFVQYGSRVYALKELPERLALREYRLLRALGDDGMPVVEVVGVATDRQARPDSPPLDAILITEHLEYSLPYRMLFGRDLVTDLRTSLLDALVQLLVRLHLGGFFWGDCSLSNTLFRRDAGALAAYLVDAETGELHPELTPGQREHDLEVAEFNVAGDLLDLEAGGELPDDLDPIETAAEIRKRYASLWSELTRDEMFDQTERWRIDQRLRQLNELGFDVDEIELVAEEDGTRLRLPARVVEPGHHRRRLFELTGLLAQENQARRMLNDLAAFRACIELESGKPLPEAVAAHRWLLEVFEPAIAAVPDDLGQKLAAAEVFHQILDHRWFRSEAAGRDVGMEEAIASYVDNVLPHAPDERKVLAAAAAEPDELRPI
jgi:hypothetical protein